MKLAYVEMRGFRGFLESTRVDVPMGFAVIVGPNGAGKSTVCDAIEFVLTGEIRGSSEHKEKGETIHDYLWWRGAKPANNNHVELGFISPDGGTFRVRRTPTDLTIVPTADLRDLLVAAGPALENPLAQLCRTAILRDEEITRLSVDLRETERFEFVRSALGTADFRAAEEGTKRVSDVLKRQHDRASREYDLQRDRVAQLTARLSQLRAQAARASALPEAEAILQRVLPEAVTEAADLIGRAERQVAAQRRRIDVLRRGYVQLRDISARLAQTGTPEHQQRIDDLAARLGQAEESSGAAEVQAGKVSASLKEAHLQSPRGLSLGQLIEHGRRLGLQNGRCPLCGATQLEEDFNKHLEELKATLHAANDRAAALSRESADAAQSAIDASVRAEHLRTELARSKGLETSIRSELTRIANELGALGFTVGDDPEKASTELAAVTERLQQATGEVEGALSIVVASQAASQIVDLERESAASREQLAVAEKFLSDVTRALGQVKEASQTIKRVQGELVDEQLAALSPLLVELYERLRPHVDWQKVRYNLRGDVRRMLSLEVGSGLNPSFVFSSGQRRAAGLAFLLAIFLSRNWCKLSTLILDDPVQHVDDYRALHLTEVLAAVRRTGQQVLCTVEDSALAELLVRRLRSDVDDQGALIQLAYEAGRGSRIVQSRTIGPLAQRVLVAS